MRVSTSFRNFYSPWRLDQVSASRASQISGLDEQRCEVVLNALMHAGLMMRLQHDAYVRCRLDPSREQLA